MTHIGFTGTSRKPLTVAQRNTLRIELMRRIPDTYTATLHLGDAINADAECYDIAYKIERPSGGRIFGLIGHPPTENKSRAFKKYDLELEPQPYGVRDDDIIRISDEILACPQLQFQEEQRSGTWMTIRHALKADKPVTIIWPDGLTHDGALWYWRRGSVTGVLQHLSRTIGVSIDRPRLQR